ncbi:sodium:solute symporter [Pontiellaceae bacterium B1224]|nr:sodium:solute symporter [Pontiellaceae bacterium B1224]
MTGLDWLVIAIYFAVLVGIVWWSSKKQDTSADYFLAGRNIGWFAIGGSLFASNIGSEHIVGLAGSGASTGMAMAHWEMHAWVMLMLGWIFVPFYYRANVFTMPEFLEKRFNANVRWVLSVVSLIAYVFTKVSVTVYAGAIVFRTLLPDLEISLFGQVWGPFWIGAFTTVILTGIYTVFGGLRAVLFTDTAQAFILLIGSFCITFFGLKALGGWSELQSICSERAGEMALWRPLVGTDAAGNAIPWWKNNDFPWLGIMIASPVVGIWYWCTDQYIVQRTLAAKNLTNARRGAVWGSFLKVWPVLIFLVPGLIGWALHQKGIMIIPEKVAGGVTVAEVDGDQVFATMVMHLLPPGLRGLVVGGLLAALMSSLSSLFNSCASLFTVDIYEKLRPGQSEKHLVTVGRLATVVIVLLGMAWIPVMYKVAGGGLYQYLQSVQGYLAPPITAVFLLGLFWKRINAQGALAGLISGFVLGMLKLTLQAIYGEGKAEAGPFISGIADFSFLYASGVLLVIAVAVVVGVSLLTPAQKEEEIKGLTYSSLNKAEVRATVGKFDVIVTAITLVLVVGMYLYFSFWLK